MDYPSKIKTMSLKYKFNSRIAKSLCDPLLMLKFKFPNALAFAGDHYGFG